MQAFNMAENPVVLSRVQPFRTFSSNAASHCNMEGKEEIKEDRIAPAPLAEHASHPVAPQTLKLAD